MISDNGQATTYFCKISMVMYLVYYNYSIAGNESQANIYSRPIDLVFAIMVHFILTLSQTTNFRLFQTKDFADDNFKLYKNSRKFSQRVENTVGKVEIVRYKQFLLFPQCFQKTYTADT